MKEEEINKCLESYTNYIASRQTLDINCSLSRIYFDSMYLITDIVDMISYNDDFDLNMYDPNDFQKMDLFQKIDLIKKFFYEINYKIDVDEKINSGELRPIRYSFDIKDQNKWLKYLNANGGLHGNHRDIRFQNADLALDSIIMMHELGHSVNTTNDNTIKSSISEAIALYVELNANEFMRNNGYQKEAEFMEYFRLNYVKLCVRDIKSALQLYNVYVKYGKVTKENFENEYNENYEEVINSIKSEDVFYTMDNKLEYVFGIFLACYMYGKFKEDFTFSENINIANKNLEYEKNDSFDNTLKILQIDNLDKNTIMMIKDYFESYINNSINKNKKTNSI